MWNESGSVSVLLENHSTVIGRMGSLKVKGTPNSSVDLFNEKENYYKEDFMVKMVGQYWMLIFYMEMVTEHIRFRILMFGIGQNLIHDNKRRKKWNILK